MPALEHIRVALLEARMGGELASLVRRQGGRPVSVPAVRETPVASREGVTPFLDGLRAGRFAYVVFLTGAGATSVLRDAECLGRLAETLGALRQTTTVCRGPKPASVLRRHGVTVHITAAEPYTTKELLEALRDQELEHKALALLHYGERNAALAGALSARGARLEEVEPYQWTLPEDLGPLQQLVRDLIAGRLDAVAFTSQVQCRHLFQVAEMLGLAAVLSEALTLRVPVASIGPVCTEALKAHGVTPRVTPASPRMGSLVQALADYFELLSDAPDVH